ncbi:MAG: hypothetical protein AAFR21_03075 [Pseudomonadota bacterium]
MPIEVLLSEGGFGQLIAKDTFFFQVALLTASVLAFIGAAIVAYMATKASGEARRALKAMEHEAIALSSLRDEVQVELARLKGEPSRRTGVEGTPRFDETNPVSATLDDGPPEVGAEEKPLKPWQRSGPGLRKSEPNGSVAQSSALAPKDNDRRGNGFDSIGKSAALGMVGASERLGEASVEIIKEPLDDAPDQDTVSEPVKEPMELTSSDQAPNPSAHARPTDASLDPESDVHQPSVPAIDPAETIHLPGAIDPESGNGSAENAQNGDVSPDADRPNVQSGKDNA